MTGWQDKSSFKTRLGKLLLGALLGLVAGSTLAKPAAWYWWVSQSGAQRICLQTSPGSGWSRENTAFTDSHCSIRVTPF